jgi:hypothetical protein
MRLKSLELKWNPGRHPMGRMRNGDDISALFKPPLSGQSRDNF